MMNRRQFLAITGGARGSVLAGAAGVGLYAWQLEPEWVELVRRRMPL